MADQAHRGSSAQNIAELNVADETEEAGLVWSSRPEIKLKTEHILLSKIPSALAPTRKKTVLPSMKHWG